MAGSSFSHEPSAPFFTFPSPIAARMRRFDQISAQSVTPTAASTSSSGPTAPVTNGPNSAKRDDAVS